MDDNRQAAIEHFRRIIDATNTDSRYNLGFIDGLEFCINHLSTMPPTQPEHSTEVQDILQYLDEYLHPIVSPKHWSVYSELYDMISMLPSVQPEHKKGKWFFNPDPRCGDFICSECLERNIVCTNYCPNCGAKMEEQDG